jgi:hypothetical protein
MSPEHHRLDVRLWLGFLVAPAVVPVASVLAGLGAVRLRLTAGQDVGQFILGFLLFFAIRVELPLAYGCALLFGGPYVLRLYGKGTLDFWTLMTPVVVVACSLVVVLCIATPRLRYHAALAAVGIEAAGLAFYFLAVWRNPRCRLRPAEDVPIAVTQKGARA